MYRFCQKVNEHTRFLHRVCERFWHETWKSWKLQPKEKLLKNWWTHLKQKNEMMVINHNFISFFKFLFQIAETVTIQNEPGWKNKFIVLPNISYFPSEYQLTPLPFTR